MPVVTVTEAARLAGKSRPTLYRYINKGILSTSEMPGPQGTERGIDTSELLRVFRVLQPLQASEGEEVKQSNIAEQTDVNPVTLLREQLDRERQRADKAERERDEALREVVKTKDEMIELYNRLLPAAAATEKARKNRISRAFAALMGND